MAIAQSSPLTDGTKPASALKASPSSMPVVIRFAGKGAKTCKLMLQSKEWDPIPMVKSGEEFYSIVDLPLGIHQFKFMVDGNGPVLDRAFYEKNPDSTANCINVQDSISRYEDEEERIAGTEAAWGQQNIVFEESRKFPPILPPHLRYTPLNTPPSLHRVAPDGTMTLSTNTLDPENLPLPLSVTLNHVYFQRREDHTVAGVTTRFRSKFSTIVYYRGTSNPAAAPPPEAATQ